MAGRNLQELKSRYNSSSSKFMAGGPGGGPRGGAAMRSASKPKNIMPTIKRLFKYISAYKLKLIFVIFCMLFSTGSTLVSGYMLRPVINNIADLDTGASDRVKYLIIMLSILLSVYFIFRLWK